MSDADETNGTSRGLRSLLPAMLIASALGYALQLAVPLLVDSTTYVHFSAFWAMLFLCVAASSGVQQEMTRASSWAPQGGAGSVVWRRYTAIAAMAAIVVAVAVGILVGTLVIRTDVVGVTVAAAMGIVGYTVLASIAGTMYGMRRWSAVAWAILADPIGRTVLIAVAVLLSLAVGQRPDLLPLVFAVALPFPLAAAIVGVRFRRSIRANLSLDASAGRLLQNTLQTVLAATATGLMVSGLPLLISVIGRAESASLVAGSILLVTVVRAPLISPMLALQSFLTVAFRTSPPGAVLRRVALISAAILAAAGLLAVMVSLWGPGVVAMVAPQYTLPAVPAIAASLFSAGLVAVLCVTGAAVLARGSHGIFAAGWLAAAAVMLGTALIPAPFPWRLSLTLVIGPLVGVVVHVAALVRGPVVSYPSP